MVDAPTKDFAGYHGRNRPFPFSGRIIEAYYTNSNLDTVCVTYREEDDITPDGEARAYDYYMEVDETDDRFNALLKEVSYEELEQATKDRNQVYRQEFEGIVQRYVKENGLTSTMMESGDTANDVREQIFNETMDFIFNYNEESNKVWNDKEQLFRVKLLMFETEACKNASRTAKTKIRKAQTPLEAFANYYDMIKPKRKPRTTKKSK